MRPSYSSPSDAHTSAACATQPHSFVASDSMAPLLRDGDKEIIKRVVPKQNNKIHAVAVVRLYIAHPNKQKWVYTGLQGAAVLANDLVGNTYWIKLVDISVR